MPAHFSFLHVWSLIWSWSSSSWPKTESCAWAGFKFWQLLRGFRNTWVYVTFQGWVQEVHHESFPAVSSFVIWAARLWLSCSSASWSHSTGSSRRLMFWQSESSLWTLWCYAGSSGPARFSRSWNSSTSLPPVLQLTLFHSWTPTNSLWPVSTLPLPCYFSRIQR